MSWRGGDAAPRRARRPAVGAEASNITGFYNTLAAHSFSDRRALLEGVLLSRLVASATESRTVARQRLSHEHVGSLEAAHTDATVIGPLAIQLAGHRLAEHPSRASQPSPRPRPELMVHVVSSTAAGSVEYQRLVLRSWQS